MVEKDFQKKVIKLLEQKHFVIKYNASGISKVGIPDVLFILDGYFVGIEVKKDDKSLPTEIQKYQLKRINDNGGLGFVLRPSTFERFKELLETYYKDKRLSNYLMFKFNILKDIGID